MSWLHQAFMDSEKEKICFFCNEKGHLKRACPKLLSETKCYRCGELGHRKNDCNAKQCYRCKEYGHIKINCNN